MVLLYTQLMKSMRHLATATFIGIKGLSMLCLYLLLAAGFLWLINILTMPVGGIVFFSAIFTTALAGFACAVVLFHALNKLSAVCKCK